MAATKITPPLRLMLDIPAWQAEVMALPAPCDCLRFAAAVEDAPVAHRPDSR